MARKTPLKTQHRTTYVFKRLLESTDLTYDTFVQKMNDTIYRMVGSEIPDWYSDVLFLVRGLFHKPSSMNRYFDSSGWEERVRLFCGVFDKTLRWYFPFTHTRWLGLFKSVYGIGWTAYLDGRTDDGGSEETEPELPV